MKITIVVLIALLVGFISLSNTHKRTEAVSGQVSGHSIKKDSLEISKKKVVKNKVAKRRSC